jgi:nucleotide-binding universal stress UspA family protein
MKKILVPTDFSKPAKLATDVAVAIAKKWKAQVILHHILEQPTSKSFNVTGETSISDDMEEKFFTLKLIEKTKSEFAKIMEGIESEGVKVTSQIRLGNPFHGMQTLITELNVHLVVMGTTGRSQLEEMLVGSNTEKVVRHSHCPVLTIHEKPSNTDFKNIVYATSMSEREKDFSNVMKDVQELYNSTIHLVRINTPMNFKPDTVAKSVMEIFAKRLNLKNYTLNVYNDVSEEEGIIHFASSINADLIGMATHGRTGFAHVLAGSVAEEVVTHSKRPVLTFVIKSGV